MGTQPANLDRPPFSSDDRPPWSRQRYVIAGILLLAILGVGAFLLLNSGHAPPTTKPAAPALTVTTTAPLLTTWPETVAASGAITPWQEASIGTQIGNYQLVEVRVNVGDRVRLGQVLARLNPALLRAEEAQLVAAHEQAEANRQRAVGLQTSGGISEQEVLQLVTEARTAAARLAAKRLELQYTTVVAPDDGVISARSATLGAVAPAGQELFRLILRNRLEWRGELTAAQLVAITPGQRILLELPDGTRAEATVRQTAPSLDGQSRLGLVYADVKPGSRARAGMYATGEVVVGQSTVLAVPAECVVIRDGRSYVLVLASATKMPKVILREVTVGRRSGGAVEIVRGLLGGERLVLRGAGFLNEGDTVRVADAKRAGS